MQNNPTSRLSPAVNRFADRRVNQMRKGKYVTLDQITREPRAPKRNDPPAGNGKPDSTGPKT